MTRCSLPSRPPSSRIAHESVHMCAAYSMLPMCVTVRPVNTTSACRAMCWAAFCPRVHKKVCAGTKGSGALEDNRRRVTSDARVCSFVVTSLAGISSTAPGCVPIGNSFAGTSVCTVVVTAAPPTEPSTSCWSFDFTAAPSTAPRFPTSPSTSVACVSASP